MGRICVSVTGSTAHEMLARAEQEYGGEARDERALRRERPGETFYVEDFSA